MKTILVTGRNGQVGWELQRSLAPLGDVVALGRDGDAQLAGDLRDCDAVAATVRAVAPQWIVNAAAYTAVDRAESESELAHLVNATAVGELVGAAAEFPAGTAQVWCWTRLAAKSAPIEVKHVWSLDGKPMLEVPLKLNYASGRTWSHKNVRPGAWKPSRWSSTDWGVSRIRVRPGYSGSALAARWTSSSNSPRPSPGKPLPGARPPIIRSRRTSLWAGFNGKTPATPVGWRTP